MDRDTELMGFFLRRQYHIILTASKYINKINIFRFATPPNTEYIY